MINETREYLKNHQAFTFPFHHYRELANYLHGEEAKNLLFIEDVAQKQVLINYLFLSVHFSCVCL